MENRNLRHNSETYERNLRVLEKVEKPLEVKKTPLSCIEILFLVKNNSPARALVHYPPQA